MKKHRHFHDKERELWAWQQNFEAHVRLIPFYLAFAIIGLFGVGAAVVSVVAWLT